MAFWKEKQEGNRTLKEVIGIVQEPSGTLETDALQLATLQRETCVTNTVLRRYYWFSQFVFRAEHTLMLPWHYGSNRASAAKSGLYFTLSNGTGQQYSDPKVTVIYSPAMSLCTRTNLIWILKVWCGEETVVGVILSASVIKLFLKTYFCPISCFLICLWKTKGTVLIGIELLYIQNKRCLFCTWLTKKTALHIIE